MKAKRLYPYPKNRSTSPNYTINIRGFTSFLSVNFQQIQEPVSTCNEITVCKTHLSAPKAEECGKLNGHSPTSQSKTLTRTEYK